MTLDGVERVLTIERQPRIHGQQAYWLCPMCGAPRWHLYVRPPEIGCRACFNLVYASQRTRHGAALRARKIRRKLGAPVGLLSELPARPKNVWAAACYDRLVRELAICEASLAQRLGAMVERRRRKRT